MLCFPKNLIPWRDTNPGILVHEANAMSTAPRRHQGAQQHFCIVPKTLHITVEGFKRGFEADMYVDNCAMGIKLYF
jgi:hypothetical protein